ncbi:cytochrome P450 3A29-like protein, partial [Aphelenchoides avenae]
MELKQGMHALDMKYLKEYGGTYGTFTFDRPEMITSDLEMLNAIMIKDFHCFEDRMFSHGRKTFTTDKERERSIIKNQMNMLQGEDWKRVRSIVTPAFTSGKLRKLIPIMKLCSDDLAKFIGKCADDNREVALK